MDASGRCRTLVPRATPRPPHRALTPPLLTTLWPYGEPDFPSLHQACPHPHSLLHSPVWEEGGRAGGGVEEVCKWRDVPPNLASQLLLLPPLRPLNCRVDTLQAPALSCGVCKGFWDMQWKSPVLLHPFLSLTQCLLCSCRRT